MLGIGGHNGFHTVAIAVSADIDRTPLAALSAEQKPHISSPPSQVLPFAGSFLSCRSGCYSSSSWNQNNSRTVTRNVTGEVFCIFFLD
jgi:hypothetical protein